jgi:hypothetical protein
MDDTQMAVMKTAFALGGLGAGIGKMLAALNTMNADRDPETSKLIAEAVSAFQQAGPQIQEMLAAVQRLASHNP